MERITRLRLAAGLAVAALGTARGAIAAEPNDTTFELGLSAGWVPTSTGLNVSGVSAASASSPVPAAPFASDSASIGTSGFAVAGRATILTPYYGPGIFRAFLLAGGTLFVGRKGDTTFDALRGGGSLARTFAIDLAVGGNFPLCSSPACTDLRLFLGMSVVRQSASVFIDETTVTAGGKREENDRGGFFRWGTLWGASFTKPLCNECSRDALRLEIAAMLRAVPSTALGFTSTTGNVYTISLQNTFEPHLQVGLILPL